MGGKLPGNPQANVAKAARNQVRAVRSPRESFGLLLSRGWHQTQYVASAPAKGDLILAVRSRQVASEPVGIEAYIGDRIKINEAPPQLGMFFPDDAGRAP